MEQQHGGGGFIHLFMLIIIIALLIWGIVKFFKSKGGFEKKLGWLSSILGAIGLIGTQFAKSSEEYQIAKIGAFLGDSESQIFKTTIDVFFIVTIILFILGVVFLLIGYLKKK